jgi:DNA-binding MarR family transcriptional regulator
MSKAPAHDPAATALTDLILETFRLNGQLLAAGDILTRPFRLSSALWQVLGAIADGGLSAAHIARNMGLTRQSVHRTVLLLTRAGLVELAPNPHHRRARLVRLTPRGHATLEKVMRVQVEWSNRLASGLSPATLKAATRVARTIRQRLERGRDEEV